MISTTQPIDISTIEDIWTADVVRNAVSIAKAAAHPHLIVEQNGIAIARQGDVLLRRVGQAPTGKVTKPDASGRIYLVRGEATGHTHSLVSRDAHYVTTDRPDTFMIGTLVVPTEAVLVHDEHGPIIVPSGTYEVRRQRQGAEFGEQVAD